MNFSSAETIAKSCKEIANDRITSRQLFTFEFISKAIRHKFGNESDHILLDLVKLITFDALVGNNDRHFYNWGVIVSKKKAMEKPRFAPIYDSARGLLWNLSEETIIKYRDGRKSNGKQFDRYIKEACPRISIEGNEEINHFDLVGFLKKVDNCKYKSTIEELCATEKERLVVNMLIREFAPMFSAVRTEMILEIIRERFKKVREI